MHYLKDHTNPLSHDPHSLPSLIRQLALVQPISVAFVTCSTGSPFRRTRLGNGAYLTPEGPHQEGLRKKI